MKVIRIRTRTWTLGRVRVDACVLLLLELIPMCVTASVGKANKVEDTDAM